MATYTHSYNYNKIVREAKAYKYKYPLYEKYILKKSYYDKQAHKKMIKYVSKLMDDYNVLSIDNNGLYIIMS
jgi:enolase